MKVDFVTRSDSAEKFGGDTLQVEAYITRLAQLGIDARALPFRTDLSLRPDALVHIVNVDRPFDFLSAVRQAADRPVFVTPIHHRLEAVRQMRRADRGSSPRALVGRVLPEAARELLAFGARTAKHEGNARTGRPARARALGSALRDASDVWRRVGAALDSVDTVTLLARGEGRDLTADTGWRGQNAVLVPNGRPDTSGVESTPWATRPVAVLVAGRIEPRKRQAEIAEAALRQGVPVTFVGQLNENSGAYGARFRAAVEQGSPLLTWLGGRSHDDTLGLMSRARVLVNASWVEVQSLVDLEATTVGCHVVSGPNGNSPEWLAGGVHEVTGSLDDLVATAGLLAGSGTEPAAVDYRWTWDMCGDVLAQAYAVAVERRHSSSGDVSGGRRTGARNLNRRPQRWAGR